MREASNTRKGFCSWIAFGIFGTSCCRCPACLDKKSSLLSADVDKPQRPEPKPSSNVPGQKQSTNPRNRTEEVKSSSSDLRKNDAENRSPQPQVDEDGFISSGEDLVTEALPCPTRRSVEEIRSAYPMERCSPEEARKQESRWERITALGREIETAAKELEQTQQNL